MEITTVEVTTSSFLNNLDSTVTTMSSVEMEPIFGFNYIESDFLALHLVKDRNYGMVLND